jgi:hypothetical protein
VREPLFLRRWRQGVALEGGGKLSLSDDSGNRSNGDSSVSGGSNLINVNNVISGAGTFGDGYLTIDNRAGGTIVGNGSNTLTLFKGAADQTDVLGWIETVLKNPN